MTYCSNSHAKASATREAMGLSTKTAARDVVPSPGHPVYGLQQTVGNRATQSLLARGLLQPKLRIGPVDDVYEREADRTADRVMRMRASNFPTSLAPSAKASASRGSVAPRP